MIAIFYTNSTGRFAPLDDTIAVGTADVESSVNNNISLCRIILAYHLSKIGWNCS